MNETQILEENRRIEILSNILIHKNCFNDVEENPSVLELENQSNT